ncbi:MAG: PadR family transcriptional regulator [Alphaproteobacteria bacterium]|nr:MAG: PadR family transcriptional regulator [Alphaproteobacteria bacterium]
MIEKQLLKGSLKSLILKLLSENDRMYGYEITQTIEKATLGKVKLTFGALYPVLHKLESDGDVITESEIVNNRTRVYYKLTSKGTATAILKVKELQDFVDTLTKFLNGDYGYAFG